MAMTRTALTVSALGITAYARLLGRKVAAQPDVPVASSTKPTCFEDSPLVSCQVVPLANR